MERNDLIRNFQPGSMEALVRRLRAQQLAGARPQPSKPDATPQLLRPQRPAPEAPRAEALRPDTLRPPYSMPPYPKPPYPERPRPQPPRPRHPMPAPPRPAPPRAQPPMPEPPHPPPPRPAPSMPPYPGPPYPKPPFPQPPRPAPARPRTCPPPDPETHRLAEDIYYEVREQEILYRSLQRFRLSNSERLIVTSLVKSAADCGKILSAALAELGITEFYPERFGQEKYRFNSLCPALTEAERRIVRILDGLVSLMQRASCDRVNKQLMLAVTLTYQQSTQVGYLRNRNCNP